MAAKAIPEKFHPVVREWFGESFAAPLACIARNAGEGGRRGPFKAYEWNKMKTPTRILVGGPEVTSAFVLMGLALARKAMGTR